MYSDQAEKQESRCPEKILLPKMLAFNSVFCQEFDLTWVLRGGAKKKESVYNDSGLWEEII